jgi:hypothetical protein
MSGPGVMAMTCPPSPQPSPTRGEGANAGPKAIDEVIG